MLLKEYECFEPQEFAVLNMEAMTVASYSGGKKANRYEFTGRLHLVQKEPLLNLYRDDRFNKEVVPRHSYQIMDYTLTSIIQRYAARNGIL